MKEDLLEKYSALLNIARDISIFSSAESILNWDMLTLMPPRGALQRSQQLALLTGIGHRMITSPELGKLLDSIEGRAGYNDLDNVQKRNVRLLRKGYSEQTVLPEELVVEREKQSAIARDVWKRAKATNNWQMFRPELQKNIDLAKRVAEILMKAKKTDTPYDALLDMYEPGMTASAITALFTELQEGLRVLIAKIKNAPKQPDTSILTRKVSVDIQRKIAAALAESVSIDVSSDKAVGRIDETEHPFSSGSYDDVRITTHYYENAFASSIFSTLHETGHALYDHNFNPDWKYQPVGSSCSAGFQESQSRMVENIIGRSRDFWVYFLPKLKAFTGDTLADVDLDRFVFAINRVMPSKIRIEADEVSYGQHIIIRFNMERDLLAGKVKVSDVPEIWNESYKKNLGVDIETDTEGVLQDVHWSWGMYGYFPCYALGNMYCGQILAKMDADEKEWRRELQKGNFTPVKEWVVKNIHRQGNLYDPPVLMKKVTGRELTVKPYLDYLNTKYAGLYGFKV